MAEAKKQYKFEVDALDKLNSATVDNALFDQAKSVLEATGYEIISLSINAQLRIQEGAASNVSQRGNLVKEGGLYFPAKGIYLVRESPILSSSESIPACSLERYHIDDETAEKALEDSVKFPIVYTKIPVERFNEDPLTVWAFQGSDAAQEYGDFLKDSGIEAMPVMPPHAGFLHPDDSKSPWAEQLWIGRFDAESGLSSERFYDERLVRGVKHDAEDIERYSPEKISAALKNLDIDKDFELSILESLSKAKKSSQ